MTDPYTIQQVDSPEWDIIGGGIDAHNQEKAGDYQAKNLCFVLKDPAGNILGGVIGNTYWNWLSVNLMWLREDLRGQGYGSQLLKLLEDEARRLGATHAHLDTFSFQAPEFYKKNGYEVFGELADFPAHHRRYYMRKAL